MEANEQYVRSKWSKVSDYKGRGEHIATHYDDECCANWASWQAAADFTRQREEEIRQVEEEISLLLNSMPMQAIIIGSVPIRDVYATKARILARLEAVLADLKKGWKP